MWERWVTEVYTDYHVGLPFSVHDEMDLAQPRRGSSLPDRLRCFPWFC